MATLTEVEQLRSTLDDVNTMAVRDVTDLFLQIVAGLELEPRAAQNLMAEILPGMVDPYASTIGGLTTDFYFADRTASAPATYYRGAPQVQMPEPKRLQSLAGYGVSTLYKNPLAVGAAAALIAGGLQRALFDVERDTTWALAEGDPAPARYQRMTTSAEPCEFCIMLASRGAVFDSEMTAGAVVGRGVPVEATKGRSGGQGKGTRPRGPRTVGQKFHDNDRCVAVAVHPGRRQEMNSKAEEHFDLYAQARAMVGAKQPRDLKWTQYKAPDGSLKRKYRWEDPNGTVVDSEAQTKRILAAMRELRGK